MNLERCSQYALKHHPAEAHAVKTEVDALVATIAAAPKSLAFKTRALVGDNVRWYELPEEVER